MPPFIGLCPFGAAQGQDCRVIWSNRTPNKVGILPATILPTSKLIWHASMDGQYPLDSPLVGPTDFGLPFGGGLIPGGLGFGGLVVGTSATHTPETEIIIIFAKTKYRVNVPHVLTQAEIDNVDEQGFNVLDLGEYVWEVAAVMDNPFNEVILTDSEKASVDADLDFSREDREMQKLFEEFFDNNIFGDINRFKSVVPNRESAYYRMDNGTFEGNDVLPTNDFFQGFGGPTSSNPSFKDGTSKKIQIELNKRVFVNVSTGDPSGPFDAKTNLEDPNDPEAPPDTELLSLQEQARLPIAGDTIFLTYIAIEEHFVRQQVIINWLVQGGSINECASSSSKIQVINYRFYEWPLETAPNQTPVTVSGWRAVESIQAKPNFVSTVGDLFGETPIPPEEDEEGGDGEEGEGEAQGGGNEGPDEEAPDPGPGSGPGQTVPVGIELGDFARGGGKNSKVIKYLPANVNLAQLQAFIAGAELPSYTVPLGFRLNEVDFHRNVGDGNSPLAYRNSQWFRRRLFTTYRQYTQAIEHVFFNVHPLALKKRDIDKWGIQRFLAVQIEQDIKSGVPNTFFPFMDDASVDNPTEATNEFLDSSNTKFEPIDRLLQYTTANTATSCGVGGGGGTAEGGGLGSSNLDAQFAFGAADLREKFARDSKILVEKFAHQGASGPLNRLILIEGEGGTGVDVGASCIIDPSKKLSFAAHVNDEGHLVFNSFLNGYIDDGMRKLTYRPDQGTPPVDTNTPTPDQYESLLGYTSMLGDAPGYKEGKSVTVSSFLKQGILKYKVSDIELGESLIPNVEIDNLEQFDFTQEDNKLTMNVGEGFYGHTQINYKFEDAKRANFEALLVFKRGSALINIVDTIQVNPTINKNQSGKIQGSLRIPHKWMTADIIELVGEKVGEMEIHSIFVTKLDETRASDFLDNAVSSTKEDRFSEKGSLENPFIDRSVLFSTDIMSFAEDRNSNLFILFNDTESGISCAVTQNFGIHWWYYYAIIEPVDEEAVRHPFVVNNVESNQFTVFFLHRGVIYAKTLDYRLFRMDDAFLIERFADLLTVEEVPPNQVQPPPVQAESIYSKEGQILRREISGYAAAGNLHSEDFLKIIGKVDGSEKLVPNEDREITIDGVTKTVSTRKFPLTRGGKTAFPNQDHSDVFFSAYRKDNGELRLWFLAPAEGSCNMLQCHFSVDNGINWYDLWEFIEHGYDRLKIDPTTGIPFIDQVGGDEDDEIDKDNPFAQDEDAPFGINVHWSRMKRHKKAGGEDVDAESEVIDISAPYVFHQSTTKKVFLFYIYEKCLLCKMFNDDVLQDSGGMEVVKNIIERHHRSYFVDGSLEDTDLREEIHDFVNADLKQRMAEGNIIFRHQYAIDTFNEDRKISPQRVCAYDLPNGNVRVVYKHDRAKDLRAAIWRGDSWIIEDLMYLDSELEPANIQAPIPVVPPAEPLPSAVPAPVSKVTGGFGENAFGEGREPAAGGAGCSTGAPTPETPSEGEENAGNSTGGSGSVGGGG